MNTIPSYQTGTVSRFSIRNIVHISTRCVCLNFSTGGSKMDVCVPHKLAVNKIVIILYNKIETHLDTDIFLR